MRVSSRTRPKIVENKFSFPVHVSWLLSRKVDVEKVHITWNSASKTWNILRKNNTTKFQKQFLKWKIYVSQRKHTDNFVFAWFIVQSLRHWLHRNNLRRGRQTEEMEVAAKKSSWNKVS